MIGNNLGLVLIEASPRFSLLSSIVRLAVLFIAPWFPPLTLRIAVPKLNVYKVVLRIWENWMKI